MFGDKIILSFRILVNSKPKECKNEKKYVWQHKFTIFVNNINYSKDTRCKCSSPFVNYTNIRQRIKPKVLTLFSLNVFYSFLPYIYI